MSKRLTITFPPGSLVTLHTDAEKSLRIVSRVMIDEDGTEYGLRRGADDVTWHKTSEMEHYTKAKTRVPGFLVPTVKRKTKRCGS